MSEENYRKFVLYFEEHEKVAAYGWSDLVRKAKELGLPIPKRDSDGNLTW